MLSINTNLSSLITQNSMKTSTDKLNQAIERMTTGYKINHAKDNAANYSISTNMSTKISAYEVAEDNTAMGLDMITTASENLSLIEEKLSRLRALATQAQNGTYGGKSLEAIQTEANSITKEIERLYETAEYNGVKLLDSSPEVPEGIGLTKDLIPKYNGFIENPYDYTIAEVKNMTELKTVDPNTTISSGQYSISSAKELAKLAEMVNNGKVTGGEFVLANDIDLSEYVEGEGWAPIKVWNANCIFNGNGNSITGLKINRPTEEEVGLFKLNAGKIKNLGIEDCDVNGGKMTGALVGSSRYSTSLIENCYSTGVINATSLAGGLIGYTYFSKINSCYSEAEVSTTQGDRAGGLGGHFQGGSIADCFATGDVYSEGGSVGGLLGYAVSDIQINNCYATGDISANNQSLGGLVAILAGTINNCYSTGNIYNASFAGGLVGCTSGTFKILNSYCTGDIIGTSSYNGGLIGYCSITLDSSIENVRAYGKTTATYYSGGLIGRLANKSSVLTIKNTITYCAFEEPALASSRKSGSFIGLNQNTDDETVFGTLVIENCGALEQGMDTISGCYKLVGGGFQPVNYDMTDMLAGIKIVQKPKQSITLQVGINGGESSQIEFNSKVEYDLLKNIAKLKLNDLSTLATIDNLLLQISEKQTELGAIQNRLESVLEVISTQYENLVSSCSTLRDADIAEVSSTYIQQQILQQASATLMATANQSPAIALQLI